MEMFLKLNRNCIPSNVSLNILDFISNLEKLYTVMKYLNIPMKVTDLTLKLFTNSQCNGPSV